MPLSGSAPKTMAAERHRGCQLSLELYMTALSFFSSKDFTQRLQKEQQRNQNLLNFTEVF